MEKLRNFLVFYWRVSGLVLHMFCRDRSWPPRIFLGIFNVENKRYIFAFAKIVKFKNTYNFISRLRLQWKWSKSSNGRVTEIRIMSDETRAWCSLGYLLPKITVVPLIDFGRWLINWRFPQAIFKFLEISFFKKMSLIHEIS